MVRCFLLHLGVIGRIMYTSALVALDTVSCVLMEKQATYFSIILLYYVAAVHFPNVA